MNDLRQTSLELKKFTDRTHNSLAEKFIHITRINHLKNKTLKQDKLARNDEAMIHKLEREENRKQMMIEDMVAMITGLKAKNKLLTTKVNEFQMRYNNVNISDLHNTIRDLENKVHLFKNKHVFEKDIKETFKVCQICKSQIDANNNRVKRIMVTGGRQAMKSLFLSSDEDEEYKNEHQALLKTQKDIIHEIDEEERGFTPGVEDYLEHDSFESQSDFNDNSHAMYLSVDKHDGNSKGLVIDKNYGCFVKPQFPNKFLLNSDDERTPDSIVDELPDSIKEMPSAKAKRTVMAKRFSEKFNLRVDYEKPINEEGSATTPLIANF